MLAEDRQDRIVRLVREAGSLTVLELAQALETSELTVRRDLAALDAAHRLSKVHGGATSLERAHVRRDLTIPERSDLHTAEKQAIARYAASLVEPESFVYIDSGSTTLQLASVLPDLSRTAYVTNSVGHARRLSERGLKVIVLGGELKAETEALVGPDAMATLDRYHFSCGFWGANGVTAEQGFTTPDIEEAQIKRMALERTERAYVLCDASKFGMIAPVKFADFDRATIVTGPAVPEEYRAFGNVVVVEG